MSLQLKESDDDVIARQMAALQLSEMDQSDDYVPNPQPPAQTISPSTSAQTHLVGQQIVQQQGQVGQVAAASPSSAQSAMFLQPQNVQGEVHIADTSNLSAPTQQQGGTIPKTGLAFFGGFATQPPSASPAGPPVMDKASFSSLQTRTETGVPRLAYQSDPTNMSSFIDPNYAPGVRGENEYLALLPNVYNPAIPLAMNMTPEETMAMYETLNRIRAEKERARKAKEEEELALYCGSTCQLTQDIAASLPNPATGYNISMIPATGADALQQGPAMPPGVALPQASVPATSYPADPRLMTLNDNPVLKSALYQAMRQESKPDNSSITLDDIRNVMMSQDIGVNPKSANKDDKGSDSTLGSTSTSSSSSRRRRPRCTII